MGSCYYCGKKGKEGSDLKQTKFFVEIREDVLSLRGDFWRDANSPSIPFGLCRECMAYAFEEGAQVLRKMSDQDFRNL